VVKSTCIYFRHQSFWIQIKSAGVLVDCSASLLALKRRNSPSSLAPNSTKIIGDVLIHPTAKVDPSAKLGPNVTIGENVVIREGVRISNSILLENVEVRAHACVMQSIIGKNSIIGKWSRIEGLPETYTGSRDEVKLGGVTILGSAVTVAPEIIIRASIVLPHKELNSNCDCQIIL